MAASSSSFDFTIGCVGKPSAGKSSFLNACSDANAKVGNFPFTTIEPNLGVSWYLVDCPCAGKGKSDLCKPVYGSCAAGRRAVPVKVLDVAGLVPGASAGEGMGNKFLDDLRHADVLLHVVDVSGCTNAKGEETQGYDPINDIEWLDSEIHAWIFNNLWTKWGTVSRRHMTTKSTAANTFQSQLSGYGSKPANSATLCDRLGLKEPVDLVSWTEEQVHEAVAAFINIRFPTFYVLNKIDHPDADQNIAKICKKYGEDRVVLSSAMSEMFPRKCHKDRVVLSSAMSEMFLRKCHKDRVVLSSAMSEMFLRKCHKDGLIRYEWGDESFLTAEDDPDAGLKPLSSKMAKRLERLQDMVLFRYGRTGVQDAIQRAVEAQGLLPVYPVRNLNNFTCDISGSAVFRQCFLVRPGTTVRAFGNKLSLDIQRNFAYCEREDGTRISEDAVITRECTILKYTTKDSADVVPAPKKKDDKKKAVSSGTKKSPPEVD